MGGKSNRAHMPASQRAKQFLPFDAVAGLRQALKMKEHEMGLITRKELSEESQEEINEALQRVRPGDQVSVAYFKDAEDFDEVLDHAVRRDFDRAGNAGEEDFDGGEGELVRIIGKVTDIDGMSRTITVEADGADTDRHGFTEASGIKIDDIVSIDLFDSEV